MIQLQPNSPIKVAFTNNTNNSKLAASSSSQQQSTQSSTPVPVKTLQAYYLSFKGIDELNTSNTTPVNDLKAFAPEDHDGDKTDPTKMSLDEIINNLKLKLSEQALKQLNMELEKLYKKKDYTEGDKFEIANRIALEDLRGKYNLKDSATIGNIVNAIDKREEAELAKELGYPPGTTFKQDMIFWSTNKNTLLQMASELGLKPEEAMMSEVFHARCKKYIEEKKLAEAETAKKQPDDNADFGMYS